VSARARWLIWLAYVVAWTAALVLPVPDTGDWTVEELGIDFRTVFAKSVHIGAYAVMTGLTAWLRVPVRYRPLLVLFLMAHGTVTELLQLTVSHRSGQLADVAFDNLGVILGMLLTWRWWSAPDR
jgi:VanZ family protein